MIFIVIPVFNRWQYTQDCLRSLQKQVYGEYKIIVVDHGSTDCTSEFITAEFPNTIIVNGDSTMWWTAATNLGVMKALELSDSDDDFILTLNNDLIVEDNYLQELLNVYETNSPCLVGSTAVDINNTEKINFIGGTWNRYTAKHQKHKITDSLYSKIAANIESVSAALLPGRGVLIPIETFKKYGLYDETNFPHYNADDDFSFRCKRNGYQLLVAVKAVVKSHIDDTGSSSLKKQPLLRNFHISFTSIKSPNKFSTRFRWAKKNTPIPILYFAFDITRIVLSSLLNHFKSKIETTRVSLSHKSISYCK